MTDGKKLFITVHDFFDYNKSHWEHIQQFDILTQFFEHRNNLEGYVPDNSGGKIILGSEVDLLTTALYEAFDAKNIPGVVEKYLHKFEMYEVLAEYTKEKNI